MGVGERLQRLLESLLARRGVPHAVIGVESEDGRLRWLGCVYSTAGDCLRFLRGLVRGELFGEPASLALMQARWNRFGLPLDAAALRAPSWPIEYGQGLMRFRLPRLFTPLRPMPPLVGHSGSTGSWLFHCPERELLLCGTVDQANAGALPYRVLPKLLRALDSRGV